MPDLIILGSIASDLHLKLRSLYYVLLPGFFLISVLFTWYQNPTSPDFLGCLKRALSSTLLLVGFQEITNTILWFTDGLAAQIADVYAFDKLITMAINFHPGTGPFSMFAAFNAVLLGIINSVLFVALYIVRILILAVYHFAWTFLIIISPIALLFHNFSPRVGMDLIRALFEVASWKIVWSVMAAMFLALPWGTNTGLSGEVTTTLVMEAVLVVAMVGTPLIARALVAGAFAATASALPAFAVAAATRSSSIAKVAYAGYMGFAQRRAAASAPFRPLSKAEKNSMSFFTDERDARRDRARAKAVRRRMERARQQKQDNAEEEL